VEDGTRLVDDSGQALEKILGSVKKVNDIVSEIAEASREQADGIVQVNRALTQMDDMTQQNASLVEEAAASSEAMGAQAEELTSLVSYFKLRGEEEAAKTVKVERVHNGDSRQSESQGRHQINIHAAVAERPKVSLPSGDISDDGEWKEF
jgi:ABC-type transporter Mla subunit MlaD